MTIICSIDPGIKNLGICIADRDVSGNILDILLWENFKINLFIGLNHNKDSTYIVIIKYNTPKEKKKIHPLISSFL